MSNAPRAPSWPADRRKSPRRSTTEGPPTKKPSVNSIRRRPTKSRSAHPEKEAAPKPRPSSSIPSSPPAAPLRRGGPGVAGRAFNITCILIGARGTQLVPPIRRREGGPKKLRSGAASEYGDRQAGSRQRERPGRGDVVVGAGGESPPAGKSRSGPTTRARVSRGASRPFPASWPSSSTRWCSAEAGVAETASNRATGVQKRFFTSPGPITKRCVT
jgi:hypothetical protein